SEPVAPVVEKITPAPPPADLPTTSSHESAVNPSALVPPSQNVTINLINRLVQRGILPKEDAVELIRQAEADAEIAHAQAVATQAASAQAEAAQAAVAQAVSGALPPPSEDSTRVTYIPEVVKQQMRDQIKQEVMDQARDENWAAPRTLPDWVTRFKLIGDLRVRYQGDYFPTDNSVFTGAPGQQWSDYWNYNAINTSSTPFDYTSSTTNPPYYNNDQNRNRFRLRARFGAEVDLNEGFTAGIRIGTGETNSPVSENQSLGYGSGQGGNFSKYAVWLDRAFIKYNWSGESNLNLSVTVGRFDNPFFGTSMIWADDLAFDGGVFQGKIEVAKGVTPFLTMGAFPVYNTDFSYSTYNSVKYNSYDKWLYGAQIGTDWKISKDLNFKVAAAYYYFQNIEGKVSSPYIPVSSQDAGSTDSSRPAFAQRGNTYIALRNITPDPVLNNNGTTNQWQYFGLATPFHELAITSRLDYNHFEPFQLSLIGEFVNNLAFSKSAIENNGPPQLRGPVNNNADGLGYFQGGDTGWIVNLQAGTAALTKFGDWNLGVGYRYVQSDAVVDGFCDSDFGGGGTNLKGYTLYGRFALSPRVWLGLRWMSANSIAGPTYKDDVIQFDLNAKF
ncbi:MAG: putative porin, partial [Verrucomicrobiota bacterium]